ncbi:hypothetical protein R84865_002607 [Carnimonas sp. R-84865]
MRCDAFHNKRDGERRQQQKNTRHSRECRVSSSDRNAEPLLLLLGGGAIKDCGVVFVGQSFVIGIDQATRKKDSLSHCCALA